ncbi:PQQ-binding-like beta-propeller repeat protein [Streptomyces sp. NPDC101151]|uniref:outer membrane protein assembly factor BamB family protein n=1 Tax=Streptomyces sp. NPDC101151 TaxID=3366115 RepID=UPI00382E6FAA
METDTHRSELTGHGSWDLGNWVTAALLEGRRTAAATADGEVALGLWGTDEPDSRVRLGCPVSDLARHPDGWLLSLESGDLALVGATGTVLDRRSGVGGWRLGRHQDGWLAVGRNGSVALLDAGLDIRWRQDGDSAWSIAAARGLVVTSSMEGSVTCRSASSGEVLWRCTQDLPVYGCAAVSEGFVAGTAEGALLALDDHGTLVDRVATPAVRQVTGFGTGTLVACVDGSLRAYSDRLTQIWRFTTGSWVKSTAADDSTIAVASADHHLYLLDHDGRELGRHRAGHTVLAAARAGSDLAAGSADGRLYFLRHTPHVRNHAHV